MIYLREFWVYDLDFELTNHLNPLFEYFIAFLLLLLEYSNAHLHVHTYLSEQSEKY
jgi:hypothetical protein